MIPFVPFRVLEPWMASGAAIEIPTADQTDITFVYKNKFVKTGFDTFNRGTTPVERHGSRAAKKINNQ
jgi:hypothetical protein